MPQLRPPDASERAEHESRLNDPALADAVELARDAWRKNEPVTAAIRETARSATVVGGALRGLVEECGWGRQSTAEAARSSEAIASYVVKLADQRNVSQAERLGAPRGRAITPRGDS